MSDIDLKNLNDSLTCLYKEYYLLRFKNRFGEYKKNHMFSLLKKNVARLLTTKKYFLENTLV